MARKVNKTSGKSSCRDVWMKSRDTVVQILTPCWIQAGDGHFANFKINPPWPARVVAFWDLAIHFWASHFEPCPTLYNPGFGASVLGSNRGIIRLTCVSSVPGTSWDHLQTSCFRKDNGQKTVFRVVPFYIGIGVPSAWLFRYSDIHHPTFHLVVSHLIAGHQSCGSFRFTFGNGIVTVGQKHRIHQCSHIWLGV